jgi:hypothetical protein
MLDAKAEELRREGREAPARELEKLRDRIDAMRPDAAAPGAQP